MATSGTTTFETTFSISDIVEEAYERIGISGVSGYQLKGADGALVVAGGITAAATVTGKVGASAATGGTITGVFTYTVVDNGAES